MLADEPCFTLDLVSERLASLMDSIREAIKNIDL